MTQFEEIQATISNNDLEQARDLLRVALQQNPESPEVWYLAAQAAVNDSQREHFLAKAVELDPLHHRAANQLHQIRTPQAVKAPAPISTAPSEVQAKTQYADFTQRTIAFAIDQFILFALLTPAFFITVGIVEVDNVVELQRVVFLTIALLFLLEFLYTGYFLIRNDGQTLGKQWLGIRVVRRDQAPLTFADAFLRHVLGYTLSALLIGAGFFWMLAHPNAQTWHDMVADTEVIINEN